MERAVFLDRDGTINEDVGHLSSKEDLVFIPGAIQALKRLGAKFRLFIVTNQAGIGENYFDERDYREVNEYLHSVLRENSIIVEQTYCCPHTKEENCLCRKPGTFFVEQAVKTYGIDPARSFVVGDHPHDVEMGVKVGAKTVYLLTGHGRKHLNELSVDPDTVENDLYDAAEWILRAE
ncbi:MAG: HAD-IIIA family hydrolase [Candidatus Omnitrophica bacterium]|nr:HAD-IIIA family hydrolase [Candidatus Omnitrophota bacterium]